MTFAEESTQTVPPRSGAQEPPPTILRQENEDARVITETAQYQRDLRRALKFGLLIWPAFTLIDALITRTATQGSLVFCVVVRIVGEGILGAAYALATRASASRKALGRIHSATLLALTFLMAVLAWPLGGMTTPSIQGVSVTVLVSSINVPEHWRRRLVPSLAAILFFPLVLVLLGFWDARVRASWSSPQEVTTFATNLCFVLTSVLVSITASHMVWSARRQVYEARKLGRYRLVAPIGKGGMNEVWLAHDERLRRRVALKLLSRMEGVSAAEAERFEREALAASRLTSPHTIRVLDFGASDDGIYYIAMEYLPGVDLDRLVREQGPMPPARVLHFARQACRALQEAHQAGVIHRDIKPHNLFVTQVDGEADHLKLLDFGLARMQEPGMAAQRTATGVIRGTPAYLPPEAWAGGTVDARSDLYSLGATLFHLLAGVPPFHHVGPGRLVAAHLFDAPPAPSVPRGQPLPPALEQLVLKCLAKNPAERFASAEALLEALEACAAEIERWTPREALPQTGAEEASVVPESAATQETK